MTVIDFYNKLCEIIPTSLSCEWDHDGLESCPEPWREVKKVFISLDVTCEVIEKAAQAGADVIISHHPVFFGSLSSVNALTHDGAKAVKLAKNGIAVMSFHTRLDALTDGVNDTLASIMGLEKVETVGNDQICRVGELSEEMDALDFVKMLKERLSFGEKEREAHIALCPAGRKVKRVALVGGGGGGEIALASSTGADTYVTGELKHHERLSATDFGMNLICAGHFFTEHPVCDFLEKTVKEILPEAQTEVIFSNAVIEI
jgi:dinuclear metal center YbgI/SA1388 family protein